MFLTVAGTEALYADLRAFRTKADESASLLFVYQHWLLDCIVGALVLSDPTAIANPFTGSCRHGRCSHIPLATSAMAIGARP